MLKQVNINRLRYFSRERMAVNAIANAHNNAQLSETIQISIDLMRINNFYLLPEFRP